MTATGRVHVLEPAPLHDLGRLEAALLDAFRNARDALVGGARVVVVVRETDLLGHGEAADAALTNALAGLVRALATEGWSINALAVTDGVEAGEREAWIDRLSDGRGARGVLVRLGDLHLGRVPL